MRQFYIKLIETILPEYKLAFHTLSDHVISVRVVEYKVLKNQKSAYHQFKSTCNTFLPVIEGSIDDEREALVLDFTHTVAEDCLRMYMTCREFFYLDCRDDTTNSSLRYLSDEFCDQVEITDESDSEVHDFGSTTCTQDWREVYADCLNMIVTVTTKQINEFVNEMYKGDSDVTDAGIMGFKNIRWDTQALEDLFDEIDGSKKGDEYVFTPYPKDIFQINKDEFQIYFEMELSY